MKNPALVLLILACSGLPQSISAQEHAQSSAVSLTVSAFNDAGVEPSVWPQAQSRATEIMHRSGISLTWLDCGSPATLKPDPNTGAPSDPPHYSVTHVPARHPHRVSTFDS